MVAGGEVNGGIGEKINSNLKTKGKKLNLMPDSRELSSYSQIEVIGQCSREKNG